MSSLQSCKGSTLPLLGLATAAVLCIAGWVEFSKIRQAETLQNSIISWENQLLALDEMRTRQPEKSEWDQAIRRLESYSKEIESQLSAHHLLHAGSDPAIRLPEWSNVDPSTLNLMTQVEGHHQVHRLREQVLHAQVDQVEKMGMYVVGAGGITLVVILLTMSRLNKAKYRAEHPLPGLIPICAWCGRIRQTDKDWKRVDMFLRDNIGTRFTHSLCPKCMDDEMNDLKGSSK